MTPPSSPDDASKRPQCPQTGLGADLDAERRRRTDADEREADKRQAVMALVRKMVEERESKDDDGEPIAPPSMCGCLCHGVKRSQTFPVPEGGRPIICAHCAMGW